MTIEISQIATDAVDALKIVKDEIDLLQSRVAVAEEKRSSVENAVYLRVMSDYRDRLNGLDTKAAPLRAEARLQYSKLSELMTMLDEEQGSIKLDRQEVEFRHQLGEYDDADFKKRIKALDDKVGKKANLVEQAETLKKRFLAAVNNEQELISDHPSRAKINELNFAATKTLAPVVEQTTQRAALPTVDTTGKTNQPSLSVDADTNQIRAVEKAPSPPPIPTSANPGATMVMPAVRVNAAQTQSLSESTVVMRAARLVPQNPEAGKTTHVLGLKPMTLGTDGACEIRVLGPGIDAKHATINPASQGYILKDMGSSHGTRINAVRITEQLLDHEDVIQIGAARLVFRLG